MRKKEKKNGSSSVRNSECLEYIYVHDDLMGFKHMFVGFLETLLGTSPIVVARLISNKVHLVNTGLGAMGQNLNKDSGLPITNRLVGKIQIYWVGFPFQSMKN